MNKEVIKAINSKKKNHSFCKWWNKNGYKIMRVIFFPIWIGYCVKDKIKRYSVIRNAWDEEKAKEILNYYIPHRSDWDAENNEFYFFDNGYGWNLKLAKKHLKRKDRNFWSLHTYGFGGEIRNYLINDFELDGFKKEIGDCYNSWTEIIFKMIKNS